MLSIAECRDLHLIMKRYLDSLLENKFFYGNLDYRENISAVVRNEIPLFKFLSSKLGEDKSYQEMVDRFKEFFLLDISEVQIDPSYEDKDFNSIKDDINYLKVCIQNICKVDLDNLDKEKMSAEELNFNFEEKSDAEAVFNNLLDEDVTVGDGTLDQEFGNLILKSHAYERLNKDINDGNVYIYKTKPKINVVLKYLLFVFSTLGAVCSLATLILCMVNGGDSSKTTSYFLFFGLSFCHFFVSFVYLRRALKNDNFKYSWQKKNFLLVLLSMLIGLWTVVSDFKHLSNYSFLIWALVCILIVTSSIYSLAYFFLQPERDTKLIDSILEKHISDLSSKGVSFK